MKNLDSINKIFDQGEHPYNYGYDVGQKITYLFVILLCKWLGPDFLIGYCIIGRIFIIGPFELLLKDKHREKRLFNMSNKAWKYIVLFTLIVISIINIINNLDDVLLTAIGLIFTDFICFFILAGQTTVKYRPGDPDKIGTGEWKKKNGVVKVSDSTRTLPLYRDKYGNYYEGTGYAPVPAPVTIKTDKK